MCTISPQAPVPQGKSLCLPQSGGAQYTDAKERAHILYLGGNLVGYQGQGIVPEIPGQVPTPPPRPRLPILF